MTDEELQSNGITVNKNSVTMTVSETEMRAKSDELVEKATASDSADSLHFTFELIAIRLLLLHKSIFSLKVGIDETLINNSSDNGIKELFNKAYADSYLVSNKILNEHTIYDDLLCEIIKILIIHDKIQLLKDKKQKEKNNENNRCNLSSSEE